MMYHAGVIGGGIAGLSFALDLKSRGYSVVLFEKGSYPRHKVCGEYISMESYEYLLKICPALSGIDFPLIKHFQLSSTGKPVFKTALKLGGFGISRYLLEQLLYEEALAKGINVLTKTTVRNISQNVKGKGYLIETGHDTKEVKIVVNSTGRLSNINENKNKGKTNYVGVKYHIKTQRDSSLIEIHNFPGGYCGISGIEEGKSCLCYMINSRHLKQCKSSISETEQNYIWQNKNLEKIFKEAEFIYKEPVTTSGIRFLVKQPVLDGIFYLGDAAGSIAPITGNGMSMGLRGASVLAAMSQDYFEGRIKKEEFNNNYSKSWKKEFQLRIKLSRHFQKLAEYPLLAKATIKVFTAFPYLAKQAIKQTHGDPF